MNYNFSISFNGEDLFYFKNNKYFFKIKEKALENNLVFGRMLFKKYTTILNFDRRQVFFYIDNSNSNNETKSNPQNEFNLDYKILIIIAYI